MEVSLYPLARSDEELVQEGAKQVRAPLHYLEDGLKGFRWTMVGDHVRAFLNFPFRYLGTLWYLLRRRNLEEGYVAGSRFYNFHLAIVLIGLISREQRRTGRKTRRLHAHFAHDPALVAYLVHRLTGIPYSFTAHARDLYQIPPAALVERVRAARAVVTCCAANLNYLREVVPESEHGKLHLIYHGINLRALHPGERDRAGLFPLIVSAGRLIEKKGFSDLLLALAQVKQAGCPFYCRVYGDGPLRLVLAEQIRQYGLENQVQLAGAYTQDQIQTLFSPGAVFALTPTVAEDGDRDGIPNVLMEAMACGLPVVSTTVGGIPELVVHGQNGLLFAAHDVPGIAGGLVRFLSDEPERQRMAQAARQTVEEDFDQRVAAHRLAELFEQDLQKENG